MARSRSLQIGSIAVASAAFLGRKPWAIWTPAAAGPDPRRIERPLRPSGVSPSSVRRIILLGRLIVANAGRPSERELCLSGLSRAQATVIVGKQRRLLRDLGLVRAM